MLLDVTLKVSGIGLGAYSLRNMIIPTLRVGIPVS